MLHRHFSDLEDFRLVHRGNNILDLLFVAGTHFIRGMSLNKAEAKGMYRFLNNDRVSERPILIEYL